MTDLSQLLEKVAAQAIYDDAFTDGHVDEGEVSMKYCRSAAQAALSALDAAGFAVVPKEPTEAMLTAARAAISVEGPLGPTQAYRAMLSAAQVKP